MVHPIDVITDRIALRVQSEEPLATRWNLVDLACKDGTSEVILCTKLVRCPKFSAVFVAEAISHLISIC